MALHTLRKTLISFSLRHESSNLNNPSNFPSIFSLYTFSFSTLINSPAKPPSDVTEHLINRHSFSPEAASETATFLSHLKNYKRSDLVLDYLKNTGLSNTQVEELVLRDPRVLVADLNKCVKPKLKKIRNLGFSDNDLGNLLCNVPGVLTLPRAANTIASSILILKSVLGSNSDVVKLLKTCNWFLSCDLGKILVPNIELMKSYGVTTSQMIQILFSFPRFFLLRPEFMRDCVRRVEEMGLKRDSKMFIHGVRAVSSMNPEKWESKLELFRGLGFSEDDILSVFRRTPQVFAVSERKIVEVLKLLLSSESVDLSFVVQHPELLIYSATHRIKPRLEIINVLLSKSLLKREPSMTSVCKLPDEGFIRRFILPYACEVGEAGEKYIASRGIDVS